MSGDKSTNQLQEPIITDGKKELKLLLNDKTTKLFSKELKGKLKFFLAMQCFNYRVKKFQFSTISIIYFLMVIPKYL